MGVDPTDSLDVLSRRADLLERLVDEPRHKAGLEEDLAASGSTIDRAIAELEDVG